MSIYIPGMGMPQRDEVITIYPDGTAHCHHLGLRLHISESKAVPVPEHGRLIDANKLTYLMGMDEHFSPLEAMYLMGLIVDAPTIIPAEPPKEEHT